MLNQAEISQAEAFIQLALREDIADGDLTTLATIPANTTHRGKFVAKQGGIVAGLWVAQRTFALLDKRVTFTPLMTDGDAVKKGADIATIDGPAQAILSGERVALNFMQRMSGIATLTGQFVKAIAGTNAVMLDTRKTAPGLRLFDKWAVQLGGGQNHRFGLYDMAMVKENHITAVGSLTAAVARIRAFDDRQRPIEVEVKNLTELREVLPLNVDRILLDNMSPTLLREAVAITGKRTPLEASGNVSLATVRKIAETGVDYISSGMLTHSVTALDISLLFDENQETFYDC